MEKSLISVIVPCYNTGKYIKKAMQSILNQTYTNIEILAVDQNSSDNTLSELLLLSEEDKRLKIINSYHIQCTGTARNIGLIASKG